MLNFLKNIFKSNSIRHSSDSDSDEVYDQAQISKGIEAFKAYVDGLKFQNEGDFKEALKLYDFAVENGLINNSDLYKYRGICHQQFGQHLLPIKDFDDSIALNRSDGNNYYLRAKSKWEINDFDGYKSDLHNVILFAEMNNSEKTEDDLLEQTKWETELKFADELIQLRKEKLKVEDDWKNYLEQAKKNAVNKK